LIIGAKSGATFSLKAYCNLVRRLEVVILLRRLFSLHISHKISVSLFYEKYKKEY